MDPARPRARSLAIRGHEILAVGDDAEIQALACERTRRIELDGHTVTPGLIDAHAHLYGLGVDEDALDVRGLASEAAAAETVARAATARPPGEWLLGRGWDQNRWPGQAFPTRASLDRVVSDRPVLLRRVDGHAAWINGVALARAKITRATPDPSGGKIVRDARGEPTGVLIDNAIELVDRVVPVDTADQRRRRIVRASEIAVSVGLTGVHEMGIDDATAAVYAELVREQALPLHVYALLSGDGVPLERFRQPPTPRSPRPEFRGDLHTPTRVARSYPGTFTLAAVKFFADGALGSRGARLHRPYDDDPGNRGLWVTEPAVLATRVEAAVAGGYQVGIHAIGDAAIDAVLDAYEAAISARPDKRDLRLRVEHAQVIALEDVPRMAKLGVIASMQPTHATSDMPWAEARVGRDRIRGAYAWRTMLDGGVRLAAGSDFPVEQVSPLLGLYAAVTRQDDAGSPAGGWYPAQRLTLDEAIAAFTVGAAYAQHDAERGVLAPGRPADVTVFDRLLAPDRTLLEARVDATIVDGQIVYARQDPRR